MEISFYILLASFCSLHTLKRLIETLYRHTNSYIGQMSNLKMWNRKIKTDSRHTQTLSLVSLFTVATLFRCFHSSSRADASARLLPASWNAARESRKNRRSPISPSSFLPPLLLPLCAHLSFLFYESYHDAMNPRERALRAALRFSLTTH